MARKQRHAPHADERWLLTYADMITLLMALFMVLFSMSVVNKGKFAELARSLKESFSGPLQGGGKSVLEVGGRNTTFRQARSELKSDSFLEQERQRATARSQAVRHFDALAARQDRSLHKAERQIKARARQLGLERKVVTTIDSRGLVIRLVTAKELFDVGSAEVNPRAVPLLATVARAIDAVAGNPVRVEGFTDARPYGSRHGNDDLSGDRARNVFYVLTDHGFDRTRHDSGYSGFGATHFLVPSNPYDAANRRVEIVVQRVDYETRTRRALDGPLGPEVGAGTPGAEPGSPEIAPAASGPARPR